MATELSGQGRQSYFGASAGHGRSQEAPPKPEDFCTAKRGAGGSRRSPLEPALNGLSHTSATRSFGSTVANSSAENIALEDVRTAADFGSFLKKQRESIGLADSAQKLTIFHPCATAGTIQQLEAGVFMLPLDAVFRVADFYQLSKKALLECVMRVFFSEELDTLTNSLK